MTHNQSTVMPYGAYELKATYQRNLLFGLLATLTTVVLTVGGTSLIGHLLAAPPVVIDQLTDTTSVIITIRPVPTIISDPVPVARRTTPQTPEVGLPVAVPDNQMVDNDAVIPSQQELRTIIGTGPDTGAGGIINNAGAAAVEDPLPNDSEYVYAEKPAEPVFMQKPIYPPGARRFGFEGTVVVKALVDKEGLVRDTRLLRSSGFDELDRAALDAAMLCRYSPAIQNGLPKAIWVSYRVVFKLNE
jgi:protein TonB